jgi:small subunit ribosomal protein S23
MKLQTKAIQVAQRTSYLLNAKGGRPPKPALNPPAWFKVVTALPPTANLVQKPTNLKIYQDKFKPTVGSRDGDLFITRSKLPHSTNPRHLYRIRPIRYFEDKIRKLFFKQHPWELARPKLMIENDGNDAAKHNWKSLDQPFKALDGESVVQRTLFLMETPKFKSQSWLQAYDQARLEFYRLRIREEANIQVAAEEALMHGSVFYKSHIEYGVDSEQRHIQQWTVDAVKATKDKRARFAASGPQVFGTEEGGDENAGDESNAEKEGSKP